MSPTKAPPHDLARLPNWLVWRLVFIEGHPKPRKVPHYVNGAPRQGSQGTEADRAQLVTFDQAATVLRESNGYYTGVGFALQPDSGIVALDFDDCVHEGKIAPHVEALCEGTYTELSPSGSGVRSFFKGSLLSRKDVDAKRGAFPIEVFGHNGFVTFTGNVTETCGLFGWDESIATLTPAVLQMYRDRGWDAHAQPGTISDNPLALLQPTLNISLAEVAETLERLPRDLPYDDWVKVGMGVHQQTNGQGFELWNNWSKLSEKYRPESGEKYNRERWESFGRFTGGNMLTFAWVMKLANETTARNAYAARDEVRARIEGCDNEYMLREKMCAEIGRDERLDKIAREQIAKALRLKFKQLGADYPIAECRRLVAPIAAERVTSIDSELPEWLQGWVWVTEGDKFYHCSTSTQMSITSFNAAFNRHMPRTDGAAATVIKTAASTALEDYDTPVVQRMMYLPWANGNENGVFEFDGTWCVNLFRPDSMPTAVDQLSPSGVRAVQIVKRHIEFLCSYRPEVFEHLMSMLAFMVQKPGVKIRHAILMKGIEGDGKSSLGKLMTAVMGHRNVKTISPEALQSEFSDWAHGACLGVLEEIRIAGHNRHDVYNRLKAPVTNDSVAVHPKGKPEFTAINTMNYLAFTNHNDALPVSDTDRRWLVIFTSVLSREHCGEVFTAMNPAGYDAYMDELHGVIESHPAELRRWLLDWPVSLAFNPNGIAPMTEEKRQMQAASMSPEEELMRELLAEGAPGVGSTVLSATSLLDAVHLADTDVSLSSVAMNRVLSRLGWTKVKGRVKWKNRLHAVWTLGRYQGSLQQALNEATHAHAEKTQAASQEQKKVSAEEDLF